MRFQFPEGATPLSDCSDLLLPWVQTLLDLNRVEAENISSWFQYKELHAIHRAMFGKVWGWAGKPRKSITSIGVAPGLIPLQLAELCHEVASWSVEPVSLTSLEKGARIHHRLVQIHPFENGKGRFSRLVADRFLLCWNSSHPIWPDNLHREGLARRHYIQTLQAADRGDYEPLVQFMKELGAK